MQEGRVGLKGKVSLVSKIFDLLRVKLTDTKTVDSNEDSSVQRPHKCLLISGFELASVHCRLPFASKVPSQFTPLSRHNILLRQLRWTVVIISSTSTVLCFSSMNNSVMTFLVVPVNERMKSKKVKASGSQVVCSAKSSALGRSSCSSILKLS